MIFKRREHKYILPIHEGNQLAYELEAVMGAPRVSVVRSIYMDNYEGELYCSHVSKDADRYKIRTRMYDGDETEYLEIKRPGIKMRCQANAQDPLYLQIREIIIKEGLVPMVSVSYKRLAFEDTDGFRVTIDTDLKTKKVGEVVPRTVRLSIGQRLYSPKDQCIVEVKHKVIPDWFDDKIRAMKRVRFSKFAYAMEAR